MNAAAVTIIPMSPDELRAMMLELLAQASEQAARTTGEMMTIQDLATHYRVTPQTIRNWEKTRRVPPRSGRTWVKSDVLRWDRERADNF